MNINEICPVLTDDEAIEVISTSNLIKPDKSGQSWHREAQRNQTARDLIKWGDEYCTDETHVNLKATFRTMNPRRFDCGFCMQELQQAVT